MAIVTVDTDNIDVCLMTFNEELFIEKCLLALKPIFKSVFVLDMESTDRTVEIVRDVYGTCGTVISQPRGELFERGFAQARNKVTSVTVKPWVLHIDADELLLPPQKPIVFESTPRTALAAKISRRNLIGEPPTSYDAKTLASYITASDEQHVRLYKKEPNIRWESFIHEELWIEDLQASYIAGLSNLIINHVSHFRALDDKSEKENFYAWLLLKVHNNKALQANMREFYTHEFIPKNLERFREMGRRFAEKNGL